MFREPSAGRALPNMAGNHLRTSAVQSSFYELR